MTIVNNKLVGNWNNSSLFEEKNTNFFLRLKNEMIQYIPQLGIETNLRKIDRLVGEDIDFMKSLFHFPVKEDASYAYYNVLKAKNSLSPFHVRYVVNGTTFNFRYSTSVRDFRDSDNYKMIRQIQFVFREIDKPNSKINKQTDSNKVHYYIFASKNERYIFDYDKVREFSEKNRNTDIEIDSGSKDRIFTIQELINNNCLVDIFILTSKLEEKTISYLSKDKTITKKIIENVPITFENIEGINNVFYYKNSNIIKAYNIMYTGKTMKETVICKIKNEKFTTIIDRKDNSIIYYESILSAHNQLLGSIGSFGYEYTYEGAQQHSKKFSKAFEKFKEDGALPRVLPLMRMNLSLDFMLVNKEIFLDEKFNDFIKAIIDKKIGQKNRREKSSKLTIMDNKEEMAK